MDRFELSPYDVALLRAAAIDPGEVQPDERRSHQFDLRMVRRRADAAEKYMRLNYDLLIAERKRRQNAERALLAVAAWGVFAFIWIGGQLLMR